MIIENIDIYVLERLSSLLFYSVSGNANSMDVILDEMWNSPQRQSVQGAAEPGPGHHGGW
jgi:hypothetical protein